jgi:hypothetical protein
MGKEPIILTNEIAPTPALVRAGMDALPAAIAAQGERASRRFIEFFTATIRNRNTRMAYARAVKQFFDWCEDHRRITFSRGGVRGSGSTKKAANGTRCPAITASTNIWTLGSRLLASVMIKRDHSSGPLKRATS